MNIRKAVVAILGAAVLCSVAVSLASSSPPPPATQASVTVQDSPGNGLIPFPPLTLTTAQLAALPQANVTLPDGTTESGPTLSSLLNAAGFQLITTANNPFGYSPAIGCKNDQLHYWIEASSLDGSGAVISDGELDPLFGNNPAIISVNENGVPLVAPRLAVPNDKTAARDVRNVFNITIGRADQQLPQSMSNKGCTPPGDIPLATPPTSRGDVLVNGAVSDPTAVVTWQQLMNMTQVDQNVTFLQGSAPNMREEKGPTLYNVLSSAAPELTSLPADDTRLYVEATSSEDGASTLASWAEFDPVRNAVNATANQEFLLSLGETVLPSPPGAPFHFFVTSRTTGTDTGPRLTTPGDVRGGRYDFGVQIVTVFRAPVVPSPAAGSGPNMSGLNFNKSTLEDAYLVGASLQGSNLNGVDAAGALLVNANLVGANLNKSDFSNTLLNGANLSGANLNGANMTGANLTGANLTGANLTNVTWSHTTCPDGTSSDVDGGRCSG